MKKISLTSTFILLILALMLSACDAEANPTTVTTEPPAISAAPETTAYDGPICLEPAAFSLEIGEAKTLSLRGTDELPVWRSADEEIATVTDGRVTAFAAGSVMICAEFKNGERIYCALTVTDSAEGSARLASLSSAELGMIPVRVEASGAVSATLLPKQKGVRIFAEQAGSGRVTVYDDFGHTITLSTEADGNLALAPVSFTPFAEANTLNVVLDGGAVANDKNEDTSAFQKMIDRLSENGGGTLYVPRGVYRVSLIRMREGVTLMLAGEIEDATVGYTNEIKARVDGGEFAVLRIISGDMFQNLKSGSHGATGEDNFHIRGGVLDMQGKSRCMLIVCADNVSVQNCIIKDGNNNHAIQVTGSTNVTLDNIMFAGYNTDTNLSTAEAIQVEAAANGATGGDIAVFGDAEYYFCKNVKITRCYFGKSDKYGSQTIAIGHHGHRDKSDVDGLEISGCVFDNNTIYAIKTISYSNVKITDNLFISEKDNRVDKKDSLAFILLTVGNNDITGKPTKDSPKAFRCKKWSAQGSQNVEISRNVFRMDGEKVTRRVILAQSNPYTMGADTVVDMPRYLAYGTPADGYTGYLPVQNVIYNLIVADNEITINCSDVEETFKSGFFRFENVVGLTLQNNTIRSKANFTDRYNGVNGISIKNCIIGPQMYARTIHMAAFADPQIGVDLPTASGETIKLTARGTPELTLKTDGNAELILTFAENGSVSVSFLPNEGYHFVGWTKGGQSYDPTENTVIGSSFTLTAVFSAENTK